MKEAAVIQYLSELITQNKFGGESIETFNIKKTSDNKIKVSVVIDIEKVQIYPKTLKVETPVNTQVENPPIAKEIASKIIEQEAKPVVTDPKIGTLISKPVKVEEKPKAIVENKAILTPEIKSIKDVPTITADKEGNVTIGNKPSVKKETPEIKKTSILSEGKSLYKDHYFSDDEVTYLNAYLNHEITGGEGAELLGLKKPSDFYNLVQRYKRSKNLPVGKDAKRKKPTLKPGQKMTEEDLAMIYKKVKNGEARLADMSRQFGVASSTMTIRMHKYISNNKLEPLFPTTTKKERNGIVETAPTGKHNPALDGIDYEYVYKQIKLGDTMSALAKDFGVPENSLAKRFRRYCESVGVDFHVSAIRTPLRSTAKTPATKNKVTVTVPSGTKDGWNLASDNKFHLVEKGAIVE